MIILTRGIPHEHDDYEAYEAALHGVARSPHFHVEEIHARKESSACVITGETELTQWHHAIVPFHIARLFGRWELEFSRRNLLFLLQTHDKEYHRILGHLLFFQSYNPNLVEDIKRFKGWSIENITADPAFIAACNSRPKSMRDMSKNEIAKLKEYVNYALPVDPKELELYAKYKP